MDMYGVGLEFVLRNKFYYYTIINLIIRVIRIMGVFVPIQKKQKFYIRRKKAIILITLIIKFIIV